MTDDERERAARALAQDGKPAEAVRALADLVNLTAHDDEVLPCLCRAHLDPARGSAESGGVRFQRAFAVSKGKVLWFWLPEDVAGEADEVCRSVKSVLDARKAVRKP